MFRYVYSGSGAVCYPSVTVSYSSVNEYIDWLGIHAKRWGVRKAFLRYLNFTNTTDARCYRFTLKLVFRYVYYGSVAVYYLSMTVYYPSVTVYYHSALVYR